MNRFIFKRISEYNALDIKEDISLKQNEVLVFVLIIDTPQKKNIDMNFNLKKEFCKLHLYVIENGILGQDININLKIEHIYPNTISKTYIRRVMRDGSLSFIKGLVKIDKFATGSNAYFNEKTLLLGDRIVSKVIPSLEIIPNNVKASHASSISGIREDELFYLESRGINKKDSINSISSGFLIAKLKDIEDQKFREKVINEVIKNI